MNISILGRKSQAANDTIIHVIVDYLAQGEYLNRASKHYDSLLIDIIFGRTCVDMKNDVLDRDRLSHSLQLFKRSTVNLR